MGNSWNLGHSSTTLQSNIHDVYLSTRYHNTNIGDIGLSFIKKDKICLRIFSDCRGGGSCLSQTFFLSAEALLLLQMFPVCDQPPDLGINCADIQDFTEAL